MAQTLYGEHPVDKARRLRLESNAVGPKVFPAHGDDIESFLSDKSWFTVSSKKEIEGESKEIFVLRVRKWGNIPRSNRCNERRGIKLTRADFRTLTLNLLSVSKFATRRNRVRRTFNYGLKQWLPEHGKPGHDYYVMPREAAVHLSREELTERLLESIKRVHSKMDRQPNSVAVKQDGRELKKRLPKHEISGRDIYNVPWEYPGQNLRQDLTDRVLESKTRVHSKLDRQPNSMAANQDGRGLKKRLPSYEKSGLDNYILPQENADQKSRQEHTDRVQESKTRERSKIDRQPNNVAVNQDGTRLKKQLTRQKSGILPRKKDVLKSHIDKMLENLKRENSKKDC